MKSYISQSQKSMLKFVEFIEIIHGRINCLSTQGPGALTALPCEDLWQTFTFVNRKSKCYDIAFYGRSSAIFGK